MVMGSTYQLLSYGSIIPDQLVLLMMLCEGVRGKRGHDRYNNDNSCYRMMVSYQVA